MVDCPTCLPILGQLLHELLAALVALVLAAGVVLLGHVWVVEGGGAHTAVLIGVTQVHLLHHEDTAGDCRAGGRVVHL